MMKITLVIIQTILMKTKTTIAKVRCQIRKEKRIKLVNQVEMGLANPKGK